MIAWQSLVIAPDGTHHQTESGDAAYATRFLDVLKFHDPGLAAARDESGAFHIDPQGNAVYRRRFRRTFGFYEGLAAVDDGEWLHISPNGAAAYSARYAWCGNFQEHRCAVRTSDGIALHIRPDGARAYETRFAYVGDFREGQAAVRDLETGRCRHIDVHGATTHAGEFLDLDVFHKGFARARDDEGWFHIRRDGQPAYTHRFRSVEPFYNGIALCEEHSGSRVLLDDENGFSRRLA